MCNLTAAIESSLTIGQKGKKKNEIITKKKELAKQKHIPCLVGRDTLASQPSTAEQSYSLSQPPMVGWPNYMPFITQHSNNQMNQTLPVQWQPSGSWTTSSSPYYYEVVLLPNNVSKCYGCCQEFAQKYRFAPNNVVVKHKDKRIIGRTDDGGMQHGSGFQNTYYHLNAQHIQKKNPLFDMNLYISAPVRVALTQDHYKVLTNSGLVINEL